MFRYWQIIKPEVGIMTEPLHISLKDVFRNHSTQTAIWVYLKIIPSCGPNGNLTAFAVNKKKLVELILD